MRRPFRSALGVLAALGLAAFAVVWLSEARRSSARNRGLERRTADLTAKLAEARSDVAARDERIRFLETELASALRRAEEVTLAVAGQREDLERIRSEIEERRARGRAPMPEGVRLCLRKLEDLLRDDGYDGVRFVEARTLEDRVLREVEMVERSLDGRSVAYTRAGELTAELDREHGVLVLRARDGHRVVDGVFEELPEQGHELRFEEVFGPTWERELPFLVRAVGEYAEDPEVTERLAVLDPVTRERWRQRLATVLAAAETELRYDVGRFRTVRNGRFVDVSLHAYDGRRLLMQSAEAKTLAVEVDREGGLVSLLLEDGTLRKAGGETTIPASGYRILLPGVEPELAIDAMLGFVVDRR